MTRQEMEHRIASLKDVIAIIENERSEDNPLFEMMDEMDNGIVVKRSYLLALCRIEHKAEHLICELLHEGGI